jgi:hypothetical protein
VKLRNVSLTYDVTDLFPSGNFENIRVTAFGYNLAVLKSANVIDPDFGDDNELQDPSTRYIGLKVDLSF